MERTNENYLFPSFETECSWWGLFCFLLYRGMCLFLKFHDSHQKTPGWGQEASRKWQTLRDGELVQRVSLQVLFQCKYPQTIAEQYFLCLFQTEIHKATDVEQKCPLTCFSKGIMGACNSEDSERKLPHPKNNLPLNSISRKVLLG